MAVKKTAAKVTIPAAAKINNSKLNEMIRDRAYYIWEEKGRPEGRDMEIWLQAEKEIRAKLKKK